MCGITKPHSEFNNNNKSKDGKYTHCKDCRKKHYHKNKKHILERVKKYYNNNQEEIQKYQTKYYKKNREKIINNNRKSVQNRLEAVSNYQQKYRIEHLEKSKEYFKNRYKNNKEEFALYRRKYYKINKEQIINRIKEYNKTEAGRISVAKYQAKRKRELGYTPLNNRFDGCEGHHVDNERVIFIPSKMHRSNPHRQSDPDSMIKINRLAFDYLKKECCA